MAIRTSESAVRSLIADSAADVIFQITIANEMVDAYLVSSGLSAIILKQIEMYLAAHIWQLAQGGEVVAETYDKAKFQYASTLGVTDKGFGSTKWGQAALSLDTTGTLMNLNTPRIKLEVF